MARYAAAEYGLILMELHRHHRPNKLSHAHLAPLSALNKHTLSLSRIRAYKTCNPG